MDSITIVQTQPLHSMASIQIRLCICIASVYFRCSKSKKIAVNDAGVKICLPTDWVKPRTFVNTVVCIFNELGYIAAYTEQIENVVLDIVRTATCSSQWKLKDRDLQNMLQLLPDFGMQYLAKKQMYDKRGGLCGGKPHTEAIQSGMDDDTVKRMQTEKIEECLTTRQREILLADRIYSEGKIMIEEHQKEHCIKKKSGKKNKTETSRELTDIYNTLFEMVKEACENSSANNYLKQSLSKRRKITQPQPPDVLLVYMFVLVRVYIKLYLPSVFHEDT